MTTSEELESEAEGEELAVKVRDEEKYEEWKAGRDEGRLKERIRTARSDKPSFLGSVGAVASGMGGLALSAAKTGGKFIMKGASAGRRFALKQQAKAKSVPRQSQRMPQVQEGMGNNDFLGGGMGNMRVSRSPGSFNPLGMGSFGKQSSFPKQKKVRARMPFALNQNYGRNVF